MVVGSHQGVPGSSPGARTNSARNPRNVLVSGIKTSRLQIKRILATGVSGREGDKFVKEVRKRPLTFLTLVLILPLTVTAPHVLLDSENPSGSLVPAPEFHEPLSEGLILIILDGVGENWMLDEERMPLLNSRRSQGATLHLRTGPLTLSATCVSEIMNGVPNSPSDGLRNFNLGHPGGDDPWTLASGRGEWNQESRYKVGMVGSYVYGNMYESMREIDFVDTFRGHADYYQGDIDTSELLSDWFENETYNVIGAHFSGPDKVGHRWGTIGDKYSEKIQNTDLVLDGVLDQVPENWTIIVTADHGMTRLGTHGSAQDVTREVAALVWGPKIIPGTSQSGHQRDIPALTIAVLDLPFPVQLHGRIPLEILDLPANQKMEMEKWNWEAAYERQVFLEGEGRQATTSVNPEFIEWEKIPLDNEFSRLMDLLISIGVWIILASTAILLVGGIRLSKTEERRVAALFICSLVAMVLSQAMIGYITVLPRLIGAASCIWVVWWSLGREERKKELGEAQNVPDWWPWLAASLAMSFSGLRFWFSLAPLAIILLRRNLSSQDDQKQRLETISSVSLGLLTIFGLIGVHERLVGSHWVLHVVEYGWPDDIFNLLFSVTVLLLAGFLYSYLTDSASPISTGITTSLWLLSMLGVSWLGSSVTDFLALFSISFIGFIGLVVRAGKINLKTKLKLLPNEPDIIALGGLLVLTWGAWTAAVTLLVISGVDALLRTKMKWVTKGKHSLTNPRPFIAAAVLPIAIWTLWWTMLGQVNGLEAWGLPHPRELDPGRLIVRGGYLGFREDPPTVWMAALIFTPLLLSSTFTSMKMLERGLSLHPYSIALLLQLVGCFATLAFAPPYPRLVFSLTWNIVFCIFQLSALVLAIETNNLIARLISKSNPDSIPLAG